MERNLYRIRATFPNTSEWEPEYYLATDTEAAAILFFTLRNRDIAENCELNIELLTTHSEAQP